MIGRLTYRIVALLVLALALPAGVSAQQGRRLVVPLEVDSASGAAVKGGRIELFNAIPRQSDDGKPIVLEAERYDDVTWQAANTKTMVSENWIAEVQARGAKTSFPDPKASEGAYVERASSLSYPFYVTTPGTYTIWMRMWKPSDAFWCFNRQVNDTALGRFALNREQQTKVWYWEKMEAVDLHRGNNIFFVQFLHGGKRLDKLVFSRDPDFVPRGEGPARTPEGKLDEGTVTFKALHPAGISDWHRIAAGRRNQAGRVRLHYSFDDGATWMQAGADGRIATPRNEVPKTIKVKLDVERDPAGTSPVLGIPEVVFSGPASAYPQLHCDTATYTFSARTGALSGMVVHAEGGDTVIMAPGCDRDAFRMRVKPNVTPPVEGQWVEFDAFELTGSTPGDTSISFSYKGKEIPVEVRLRYSLTEAGYLNVDATVTNNHSADVVEIELLRLGRCRIGDASSDDTLIWPVGTGKKYDAPTGAGRLVMTYPKAAVGYFDLYDEGAGLYVASQDPGLISTVMEASPDTSRTWMTFTMTKRDRVKAGGSQKTYRVTVGAHRGDWHTGADWYRAWFRAAFEQTSWPDWLKESDGWQFANLTFSVPHYDTMAANVFREAIRNGFRHVQVWGTNFSTGGGGNFYTPPKFLGGAEAFAAANKWWKDRDGIVGYYMFPNGINAWVMWPKHTEYFGVPWSEFPKWQQPPGWDGQDGSWEWATRNAHYSWQRTPPQPDTKGWAKWKKHRRNRHDGFAPHPVIGMCPVAKPWLQWYKTWVVDHYVGRFHTGSSYNDTMHYGGENPMYNPHLGLHGEGHGGLARQQWARDIRNSARKLNPDYVPTMEMQCDAYGMYFGYMIGASAIDTEMLYYTHPTHLAFEGQTGSGQYGMKRFKRFGSAWCYGSRLDHRHQEAWAIETVRMRHWITRWVNESRFLDDLGLTVDDPRIRGKLRRIMHDNGTRGILATFWNQARHDYLPENDTLKGKTWRPTRVTVDLGPVASVDDTGTRPEDWIPARAVLIDLNHKPREIDFDVVWRDGRPQVEFMLPSRWINGVLLVHEAKAEHALLARVDQVDFKQMDVMLYNPGAKTVSGQVELVTRSLKLAEAEKAFTVKPGELTTVSFPYAEGKPPYVTELVLARVTADGATRTLRAGAYPFFDDASFEVGTTNNPNVTYNTEMVTDGKRSAQTSGFDFVAEPSTRYRLSFDVMPTKRGGQATVMLGDESHSRGYNNIEGVQLYIEQPVELPKGKWTTVTVTFETPAMYHYGMVRLRDLRSPMLMDNVRLEKLADDATVQHRAAYRDTRRK